jgi:hypothetical protein
MPKQSRDNKEHAMREILRLAQRRAGKTTCPSEVARALAAGNSAPETWRSYMPVVHAAADELNAIGKISLSWKSVAMPTRSGPYRIRKSDDQAN